MTDVNLSNAVQPVLQTLLADSRAAASWATTVMTVLGVMQVLILVFTAWRLLEIGRLRERLSRLADGLALLTDTTENGFTELSRQIEELAKKPAPAARPASRRSVATRVVNAAKQGNDVAAIAKTEALSESEIRLHLALAEKAPRKAKQLATNN